MRANKASGVVPTSTGNLFVTWCPDGSSVAVINTDNTLSIVDVRKAKVVKTHRFQQEVGGGQGQDGVRFSFLWQGHSQA